MDPVGSSRVTAREVQKCQALAFRRDLPVKENHPKQNQLLKVQEVADLLRISRSAVYNLISRGLIPYVNAASGKKRVPRVRQSDLEEFIRVRTSRSREMAA